MKFSRVVPLTVAIIVGSAQSVLALDECLLGTWNADISELVRQMEEGQPSIPVQLDIADFSGSVTMTISDDMRYEMLTQDFVMKQNVDGTEVVMQMNGDNVGTIDGKDGTISIVTETFDVTTIVEMSGQQIVLPPRPQEAGPEPFTGTYSCTDTELTLLLTLADLDPNVPPPLLPHRWTK
ncbi:MAG: hypothetical protein ABJG55_02505 [Paracoccaceae bacterium]